VKTIERKLYASLKEAVVNYVKVILLFGPRQVGKSSLIRKILEELPYRSAIFNGEEADVMAIFNSMIYEKMNEAIGSNELLFIEEAQVIPNIGRSVKILHDRNPKLKIILSGSSSFELANKLQEPLTGRKTVFKLFPLSTEELVAHTGTIYEMKSKLSQILRYGSYPAVFTESDVKRKELVLRDLSTSYLYKDILQLANIKHHNKLYDLLKLLSFQIGSTVSINNLANALNLSNKTVEEYINLLEQSFVVFRLNGFARNLSKEVAKQDKIYFYDIGIRNAIISNFIDIDNRMDAGQIWENFLIAERMKYNSYNGLYCNTYFWRTYTGAEVDYIEENDGMLRAYEFKYNTKLAKAPKTLLETYNNATFETINKDNFIKFITA
jgi:uncharacterized protein